MIETNEAGAQSKSDRASLEEIWRGGEGAARATPIEAWVAAHYCPSETAWFANDAAGTASKLCRDAAQNHFDAICRQFEGKEADYPKKISTILIEYKKHLAEGGPLRKSGPGADLHSWWAAQGASYEDAKRFCAIATGKTSSALAESICFYPKAEERELAAKVDSESAGAALEKARETHLKEASRPKGEALAECLGGASEDPGIEARRLIDEYGFGSLSISDAIPKASQARMIAEARSALGLAAKATGFSRGSMGLGGWALRIGTDQEGSSGVAYSSFRTLELAAGTGGQALTHEWFHGLDGELAKHLLAKPDDMASESLVEYGGIKAKRSLKPASPAAGQCLGALRKLALSIGASVDGEPLGHAEAAKVAEGKTEADRAMPGSPLQSYWLEQSGTLAMVPDSEKGAFREKWQKTAVAFMESGSVPEESKAFSALISVYMGIRPDLCEEDFKGLKAALRQAKRPDPLIAKALAKHASEGASSFATRALRDDLIEKKKYMAQPCELLARAFESSACYDSAAAQLGRDPASIRMVTDYGPSVGRAPMGAERDAARKAFGEFFGAVLACQGMSGMPSWLSGDKMASAASLEGVREKLAARRRQAEVETAPVHAAPKKKVSAG